MFLVYTGIRTQNCSDLQNHSQQTLQQCKEGKIFPSPLRLYSGGLQIKLTEDKQKQKAYNFYLMLIFSHVWRLHKNEV